MKKNIGTNYNTTIIFIRNSLLKITVSTGKIHKFTLNNLIQSKILKQIENRKTSKPVKIRACIIIMNNLFKIICWNVKVY